jgi:arylsulfatase A-like enzyme
MNTALIIGDDFGWADVGANNAGCFYEAPNLHRFAARGSQVTRGYAAAPVGIPTRVGTPVGENPALDAATEWLGEGPSQSERFLSPQRIDFLSTARARIAEHLRGGGGYETSSAGERHLGDHDPHLPQALGFDVSSAGSEKGNPGLRDGFFEPDSDSTSLKGRSPCGVVVGEPLGRSLAFHDPHDGHQGGLPDGLRCAAI